MNRYLTDKDFNAALPKETSELYKVEGLKNKTSLILVFPLYGRIDFSQLSVQAARKLVDKKAPFIAEKKKESKPNS